MAIPIEYPPPGSTTEEFQSSTQISTFWVGADRLPAWHPKLTLYRLLMIFSPVGLGAAKAVTSYLNLTPASITLEWILSVVLFLVLHILGTYENAHTRRMSWLFKVDYLDYLWDFLYTFARIRRPIYRSDEDREGRIVTSSHPPMTGYRLLVTSTVFIFGMTKSGLVYGNRNTEATTVECIFGVFIVTGLYWLGLYEESSIKVYPILFHVDYSSEIAYFSNTGFWLSLHLIGMSLAAGWTYAFSFLAYVIYTTDLSMPPLPPFIVLVLYKAPFMSLFMAVCATGPAFIFLLLRNLYRHSEPFRVSPGGRFLALFIDPVRFKEIHEKYWLPTPPSHRRERFFYLKRALIRQVIKLPGNYFYFLVFFVTLVMCTWLPTGWIALLIVSMDSGWLFGWILASVVVLPAIGIYSYVVLYVLYRAVSV